MRFKLVRALYANTFEEEVSRLLSEGWELHGNPFMESADSYFCQALIWPRGQG